MAMALGSVLSVELSISLTPAAAPDAAITATCGATDKGSSFMAGSFTASVVNSLAPPGKVLAAALRVEAAAKGTSPASPAATGAGYNYNSNTAANVVALLRQDGIYARPLGNVVYLMPSPMTSEVGRARLVRVLKRCITKAYYLRKAQGASAASGSKFDNGAGPATIV
jgi:dethiobiotin synthetase/adenosylmethionine--8-amino-7-oxononanoate aminotransferase